MESTAAPATQQAETLGTRARNVAIATFFALVLLIPKLLNIRHNERYWTVFRILLGLAGAALVILPLSLWNSWLAAIAGLAMFLTSILLPPAAPITSVDERAKELGVLVVVNGGHYRPANAAAEAVRLFVGVENVWAIDSDLRPLLAIPASEISGVRAEEIEGRWVVRVRWTNHVAEFSYRGIFAEHFARVAESTLRSLMRSSLPILSRSRAAGA